MCDVDVDIDCMRVFVLRVFTTPVRVFGKLPHDFGSKLPCESDKLPCGSEQCVSVRAFNELPCETNSREAFDRCDAVIRHLFFLFSNTQSYDHTQ